ncbi:DUF6673 family protein [Schnuerera sp.]|uniref:DUF6673 family protein n=1 Tax=Schnuerera sp. TaxID=2794844 RepID=UPI002BA773B4|nr:DUF6673 family protein [Schnuerera sp.]HSH35518.1 DUF6673 family protein [Schnuerera sp.]
MVRKFEFKNNDLELDIAGEKFYIDPFQPDLFNRIEEGKTKLLEEGDKLKSLDDNSTTQDLEKGIEQAIKTCTTVIDSLLGENSTERIFKERRISFLDAVDVAHFIFIEIESYIQSDVVNKYSPNRAQRRSKK